MAFDTTQIPLHPPAAWFTPPADGIPTDKRVTITADGRVFGYIALWNACHVGMEGCTKPPKGSPSDYTLAHTGTTMTADAGEIPTANIGGGVGHMGPDGSAQAAAEHYDNSATQLMRVAYGEDETGLWFAGALWPDVKEIEVERLRASALSGDWRFVSGYRNGKSGMDFTGAVLVNIPGFPLEANGGVSTESGYLQNIAASMNTDLAFIETVENAPETNTEGHTMSDECKCKDEQAPTIAALVEPMDPEAVAAAIEEIIAKHAIASVEELISVLRPRSEGDDVETNQVDEDTEAELESPEQDEAVAASAAGNTELENVNANIEALTDMMAELFARLSAQDAMGL